MTKKNDAVATTGGGLGGLPVAPQYINTKSVDGKENLNAGEDTVIPRLKIAHEQTREHVEKGVPIGHFTTNLYGQDLGDEVQLPIIQSAPGFLMFDGVGANAKLIARKFRDDLIPPLEEDMALNPANQKWTAVEIKDPRTQMVVGRKNVKPLSQRAYLYIGVMNQDQPVALTLKSSEVGNAKRLNSMLLGIKGPSYGVTFKVKAVQTTGPMGTWYVPEFEALRWNTEDEIKAYAQMYQSFKVKKKDVSFDNDDATEPVAPVDPETPGGI